MSSIKLRKKLIEFNNEVFLGIEKQRKESQLTVLTQLNFNLNKIKNGIYLDSFKIKFIFLDSKLLNPIKLDSYVIKVIQKNILFCNKQILNQVKFYPSNFNLK